MSDPLRTDAARVAHDAAIADRDARIEQLLLAGLDHYFAGDFEHAINVWSRVVFLEREHSRARAYIERARGALAERHRESEELLHRGVDAFNRGDTGEARALINQAVEHVGPNDVALVFLERLNRLDPAGPEPRGKDVTPVLPAAAPRRRAAGVPERPPASSWLGVVVAVVAAAAALLLAGVGLGVWFAARPSVPLDVIAPAPAPLPVARASEIALARARQLNTDGHLREALHALETVEAADPLRAAADVLQSEIQRRLLDSVGTTAQP